MKARWGTLLTLSLVLVLTPHVGPIFYQPVNLNQGVWTLIQYDCEDVFKQLTKNEDWFEQLINPTLTTQDEISEYLDLYSKVYDCIGSDDVASLSDELLTIRTLTEYFLIFAGGAQTPEYETALVLTSFEQSNDKAIVRIRDDAGISPPKGYIFVRFYSSLEVMPDLVQQAFENEDTSGVTILMRYVAVLNEEGTQPQEVLQELALPETISHELVHAYVNSILVLQGQDLPEWYQEGIAIYFSGSGKIHSIVNGDFTHRTIPTEKYQQYDTNFKYLEVQLGRKELLERIKQSVELADPSILYRYLGIANDQVLADCASAWQQQQQRKFLLYTILVSLLIISIPFIVLGIVPKVVVQLSTRCQNCGYAGRRKEFANNYCPNCNRRYDRKSLW